MPVTALELWRGQDRHPGDRERLFRAVAAAVGGERVLYPGSYVDLAASFVWPDVTYVDLDRRAARFFADTATVADLLAERGVDPASRRVAFVHGDYTGDLGLVEESVDLLVSLYAGFVSEACTRYLRVGGHLLVNPSHGDAALAAIDERYELAGVVTSREGRYVVRTEDLDSYLVPRRPELATREQVLARGRAVAYTRSPFAYLFRRHR